MISSRGMSDHMRYGGACPSTEGWELRVGRAHFSQISGMLESVEGRREVLPHMRAHVCAGAHMIMTPYSLSIPSNIPENCRLFVLPPSRYRKGTSFHGSGA